MITRKMIEESYNGIAVAEDNFVQTAWNFISERTKECGGEFDLKSNTRFFHSHGDSMTIPFYIGNKHTAIQIKSVRVDDDNNVFLVDVDGNMIEWGYADFDIDELLYFCEFFEKETEK